MRQNRPKSESTERAIENKPKATIPKPVPPKPAPPKPLVKKKPRESKSFFDELDD
jgi:hypothetical protein